MSTRKRAILRELNLYLSGGLSPEATGLVLAIVALVAIVGAAFWVTSPVKPVERFEARVASLDTRLGRRNSSDLFANLSGVGLTEPVAVAVLPPCSIGDRVDVLRLRTRIGIRYRAASMLCKPPPLAVSVTP